MNETEDAVGQDRVIPWKDIEANDPKAAKALRQDFNELIDEAPDDVMDKAAGYLLEIPDYPEDYRVEEIADFERGKEEFRRNTSAYVNGGTEKSASHIRAELHRLSKSMSAALLAEGVDVMGSGALLNIPEDMTEEELRMFEETDAEIERGEFVKWEDIKRADIWNRIVARGEALSTKSGYDCGAEVKEVFVGNQR